MMIKSSSKSWMRLAYLALIPLLAALVYACNPSKNAKVETSDETVVAEAVSFQDVEVKPTFNDGDDSQFARWIYKNVEYPESAISAGVQGRMLVRFSIMPDGSMDEFEVVRGINPDLDAEVLHVMKSCDLKWTPGMQNGKPVKVTYNLPIVFRLQE